MTKLWQYIVWIFEKADIIPPIIAVSVWHYAGALAQKDPLPVAVVIGALVDIGHYRSVKAYFKRHELGRFLLMAVFTALTGWYHYLWYGDILLAAGMPTLIIGLAILSTWEGWERQARPKIAVKHTEKLPETTAPKKADWRTLPEEDRVLVAVMRSAEIAAKYGISERTARNWRKSAGRGKEKV